MEYTEDVQLIQCQGAEIVGFAQDSIFGGNTAGLTPLPTRGGATKTIFNRPHPLHSFIIKITTSSGILQHSIRPWCSLRC